MAAEAGHAPNRIYTDQNGDFHLNGASFFNDAEADIAGSLEVLNALAPAELNLLDGVVAGTVTASLAVAVDANKDISAFRNVGLINLDAGSSGAAGTVDVFPTTAAKGKLAITAADSAGDTTTTIVNASQAGARTYTIPDAGASASFVMTAGAETLGGVKTFTNGWTLADGAVASILGNGTGTGDVVQRIGGTATEGLELRVYEETVSPAAVETNLINIPASSRIVSVQANVETALTGGGTTVTWSIGTTGDPDKYGTSGFPSASDALTQNSKSDFLGNGAVLDAAEQMVLTGTATGGAADGDTALTVGTVRVRVVYWALNSLDNA